LGENLKSISVSGELFDSSQADKLIFSILGKARLDKESLQADGKDLRINFEQGDIKTETELESIKYVNNDHISVENIKSEFEFNDANIGPLTSTLSVPSLNFSTVKNLLQASGLSVQGILKEDPFEAQSGAINLDVTSMQASVQAVDAKGEYQGKPFNLSSGQLDVSLNTLKGTLLSLSADGVFQENSFDVNAEKIDFDGKQQAVAINEFDINAVIQELVGLSNRPIKAIGNSVKADLSKQTLSLDTLNFVSEDMKGILKNVRASNIVDDPKVSGKAEIDPFNLRSLLQQMSIDYEPQQLQALTSVGINANVSGALNSVDLKQLNLKLDDSSITGKLAVNDFSNPSANFDLVIDTLNLDDYMPESNDKQSSNNSSESLAIPLAVFDKFKANGKLKVKQLNGAGLDLNNVAIDVKSAGDITTMTPSASLYDGSLAGTVKYEKTPKGGRLSLKQNLKSINLLNLFKDLDMTDQVSGVGSLGVDLIVEETNGKQSNQGEITLSALDGVLRGVDLQKVLATTNQLYSAYKGRELVDKSEYSDETKFASLGGTFKLNNYLLDNLDFDMKAPLFRVRGKGEIDLAKQVLDYTVNASVVETLKGQGGESLDKLKGLTVPIKFSGDLLNPKYRVDMEGLIKSLAGKKLDKKINEIASEKLGVENASGKTTKQVLKSAASKEIEEKYGVELPENASGSDLLSGLLNKELKDRGEKKQAETNASSKADVAVEAKPKASPPADTKADVKQEAEKKAEQPLTEEELKDQAEEALKKKLLESLFK